MQKMGRCRAMRVAGVAAAVAALSGGIATKPASAQAWPAKPVRIVVAFPPGGISDFAARAIAPGLTEAFRQTVVVENRGGAAGAIGTEVVAKSAAQNLVQIVYTSPSLSLAKAVALEEALQSRQRQGRPCPRVGTVPPPPL
jgi:tripartite-type tricarboxylate transporter receptor subunit TctC